MKTDPMLLHLHVMEIERKSDMVLACVPQLNDALNNNRGTFGIFVCLHNILFNSAAVSLSFWPTKKHAARGEDLRRGFKLENELLFLKERDFRNHIAHFDERLDEWFRDSKNHNIAHSLVGPRNMIGGDAIASTDIFDHYVPGEKTYLFRGDEYNIQKLIDCISKVKDRAAHIGQHHWMTDEFSREFML